MEYIPCIGNSSYSFWRILLKLYSCFQDGLKICICFLRILKLFFLHFNLDIFSSLYATDMYREYMPCIGNPAYSFRPILLKLSRYFAAFLWFHMRNLSLAGYNCSGGASCMACSFINKCDLSFLSIVWCSESAHMYDHIFCGRASVHFKLICSFTCKIWKEDIWTCTSKRSIDIVFLYIMQHLETSGTSKHYFKN